MSTTDQRTIFLASEAELHTPSYYNRLWLAAKNQPLSRRAWLDEIADCFRDFEGTVYHQSGQIFEFPEVDSLFPDCEMRWLSYYLEPSSAADVPRRISRHTERLRILDLYFRIQHPDLARHFGR